MSYRINLEHYEQEVDEKIENRDRKLYKSKSSYVLAAIKQFEESRETASNKNILELERKMMLEFEKIEKLVTGSSAYTQGSIETNIPDTADFYR